MLRKFIFFVLFFLLPLSSYALTDNARGDLLSYSLLGYSNVKGPFTGSDYNKLVQLQNGMVFRFKDHYSHYSYSPIAAIYIKHLPNEEVRRVIPNARSGYTLYKLIIDDHLYDAQRIR